LFADIEKGKHAKDLQSGYLAGFGITAGQFNALRIQLLGKIEAIRKQIPLQIKSLKTKIQKAKKTIGSYSLRLRLPTQASARDLFITGVRFAYGQEQFEESLACGRALSYRFLQDGGYSCPPKPRQ
jgi:hypothetical protein